MNEDYNSEVVADLKAELSARGLSTDGLKADLVARLEENDAGNAPASVEPASEAASEPDEPTPLARAISKALRLLGSHATFREETQQAAFLAACDQIAPAELPELDSAALGGSGVTQAEIDQLVAAFIASRKGA